MNQFEKPGQMPPAGDAQKKDRNREIVQQLFARTNERMKGYKTVRLDRESAAEELQTTAEEMVSTRKLTRKEYNEMLDRDEFHRLGLDLILSR